MEILGRLTDLPFTRVLAGHGRAMLEEWAPGTLAASMEPDPQVSGAAGELLGRLHTSEIRVNGHKGEDVTPQWYLHRAEGNLASLVGQGKISTTSAGKLLDAGKVLKPAKTEIGIIHMDFCAENMVWTPVEKLVVFDNERFRFGPLDFDLARCFMRWPQTAQYLGYFRKAYEHHRSMASFDADGKFWKFCALAQSAWYGVRAGSCVRQRLTALEEMANGL